MIITISWWLLLLYNNIDKKEWIIIRKVHYWYISLWELFNRNKNNNDGGKKK